MIVESDSFESDSYSEREKFPITITLNYHYLRPIQNSAAGGALHHPRAGAGLLKLLR